MAGNTFGSLFRITTFGESHGTAIGVIIDGCPAGLKIDETFVSQELQRRKPGQSHLVSQRDEKDDFELLSGVFEGFTLGTPIMVLIRNKDQRASDYEHLKEAYRPSHADFTYDAKYGRRDYRGGGRSSARETVARVAAGAIAKLLLQDAGISIQAFVKQIGNIEVSKSYLDLDLSITESSLVRCPEPEASTKMISFLEELKQKGDTAGGIIQCILKDVPAGLGEPVFDKLHADLGKSMLSINAVKGFEFGSGFSAASMVGSKHNDIFVQKEGRMATTSNYSGGIQGGISNGMDIYFNVAFKPVATIMQNQQSVNKEGTPIELKGKGRHDPCVVPRAVPIVEAMSALVLADHYLRNKVSKVR